MPAGRDPNKALYGAPKLLPAQELNLPASYNFNRSTGKNGACFNVNPLFSNVARKALIASLDVRLVSAVGVHDVVKHIIINNKLITRATLNNRFIVLTSVE